MNIYDLLKCIQERPGMYLGSATLSSLKDFLAGFYLGKRSVGVDDGEPSFSEFSSWFCAHKEAPRAGALGWYGAIMDEVLNDKHAFDRFFAYLAEYRARTISLRLEFPLSRAQQEKYAEKNSKSPIIVRLRLTQYHGEGCFFLHARLRGRSDWYLHASLHAIDFSSLTEVRRWLAKVFGIERSDWDAAMKKFEQGAAARRRVSASSHSKSPAQRGCA